MPSIAVNFTTPVGRLVAGSLYKGQDKDAEGRPLLVKNGPNTGQPRLDFYFAVAIPKGGETHFAQTEWGAKLWGVAHAGYPQASQNPKFAWKVTDGDSQIPNGKGKAPASREGWPGHWILHFSSGYTPRILKMRPGTNPPHFDAMPEPDAVKLGYFVQVNGNVDFNGSAQQPGIYLNHSMVCFSAFGDEIFVGPDPTTAGFGGAALPAGASMTPPATFTAPGAPVPGGAPPLVPGMPAIPGVPVNVAALPPPPAPPAVPVIPNAQFVQVPGVPGVPGVPRVPAVPAAPVRRMLTNEATYEQFIAGGWNDALLVQHGKMAA